MRVTLFLFLALLFTPVLRAQDSLAGGQSVQFSKQVDFGKLVFGSSMNVSLYFLNLTCDTIFLLTAETDTPFAFEEFFEQAILPLDSGNIVVSFNPFQAGNDTQNLVVQVKVLGEPFSDTAILIGTGIAVPASVANTLNGAMTLVSYPNPASSSIGISYTLTSPCLAQLKLYDMIGNEVADLVDASEEAGEHLVTVQSAKFPSGQYICRLRATTADGQAPVASSMISIVH
jgi:Secretion system C-terminal sorting domain